MDYPFKRYWRTLKFFFANSLDNNQFLSLPIVWLILLIFISVSFVAFTPSYIHSFLTDDYKQLTFIQPFIDKPYTIYKVFNPFFLGWYYRPIQLVYFTLLGSIFNTNPLPYYIGLLLLHAANIILVYKLARVWGSGQFGAVCAAGLFSVMAVQQEVVGWISAVSILLATFFSLLALYHLRLYLNNPSQTKRLLTVLLLTTLAILSREEVVILYPLILFFCFFFNKQYPKKTAIWLLVGYGLLIVIYILVIFLRPTWTPHADAVLDRSLANFASVSNLSQFSFKVVGSYLSVENFPNIFGWLAIGLALCLVLLVGFSFWRGNNLLRLGILWTVSLFLFLYVVIWLFIGNIPHRYLYLPWLGISLGAGALADYFYRKQSKKNIVLLFAVLILIANFLYQIPLSHQQRQLWHNKAEITVQNATQIKELIPEINTNTHFFAYDMPPNPDYIQAMAAVWYNINLEDRGGFWKRLMASGFANPNDYLLNYEDGVVQNVMPELQDYAETVFVWQENPIAELVHLDGTTTPLDQGAYELNQIIGPLGQKRFGFFIHPPAPEEGWASLSYEMTVPNGSMLTFGMRKKWGQLKDEDGIIFKVNVIDETGDQQTIFQTSQDSSIEDWTEPSIPMEEYWGQTILIQFQVNAIMNTLHDHAYWVNPRFVSDVSSFK